jgi:Domain of unknown function (DUF4129)
VCLSELCTHKLLIIALALMALGSVQAEGISSPAAAQAASFTASAPAAVSSMRAEQVARATQAVASQPDWGGWRKELRWRLKPSAKTEAKKSTKTQEPAEAITPEWLLWLAEGVRILMWLLGFAAIATALIYARRWIKSGSDAIKLRPQATFSNHVQNLDIRPQSLPQDIGAHARQYWQKGQHRQALSLLYRGALSRLVHQHRVPLEAAATEDECLSAAQKHQLPSASTVFFDALVRTWQQAVYGGRLPVDEHALRLCDGFNAAWATSPSASAAASSGPTPPHRP